MFEFQAITKNFNRQTVVENISFQVSPGDVLGVLAPGVAGKTTVMRLAANVLKADQGEIIYQGKRLKKVPGKIFGYIPQTRGIYQRARVIKYLIYAGLLNQLSKNQAKKEALNHLDFYQLSHLVEKRIGDLDAEIQQKIQLIASILHDPEILMIDEPFTGFCLTNLELIETWIRQFKEKNKLVILASRHLKKAENFCDRICFLNQGRLILNTSMLEIRARIKDNVFRLECEEDISFLKLIKEVLIKEEARNIYKITLRDKSFDAHKLVSVLNKNIKITRFEQYRPDLNDIYIGLIKTIQRRMT